MSKLERFAKDNALKIGSDIHTGDNKSLDNTSGGIEKVGKRIPTNINTSESVSLLSSATISNENDKKSFEGNSAGPKSNAKISSFEKLNCSVSEYYEILRNDVYLILKFLCNKSIYADKQTPESSTFNPSQTQGVVSKPFLDLSANATKSRILAMELLLSVYNNAGPLILTDELYIKLVQQNVTLSISRNAVTTNPALFELSLSILLLVIRHYRHHLKLEIEVLLSTVYLQILEMGNSTYSQRSVVLQALNKICGNPQVPFS